MRLKDVLPVDGSGITYQQYTFALKSHLDLVVSTDDDDLHALFAVEFDGPEHLTSPAQRRRDAIKDQLCERFGFPLLRIDSTFLDRKYRGFDLLSWITETWFLARAFYEGQESGQIPDDEIWVPEFIVSTGHQSPLFPYDLSLEVRRRLLDLEEAGRILSSWSSEVCGEDAEGNVIGFASLQVSVDRWVYAQTQVRMQAFPMEKGSLVSALLWFGLDRRVDLFLTSRRSVTKDRIDGLWSRFTKRLRHFHSGSGPGSEQYTDRALQATLKRLRER